MHVAEGLRPKARASLYINSLGLVTDYRGFQEAEGKAPALAAQPPHLFDVEKNDLTREFGFANRPRAEYIGYFLDSRSAKRGENFQQDFETLPI